MQTTLPHELLSRLSDLLAVRTGQHFPREHWGDLERGIAAAAPAFGSADAESCAEWLLSAPLTRNQIETLASHLTIGETYFFRDDACFAALEQQVFPERLRAHMHSDRRLRIWCAGCSTGEEPYSLAMLLDRLLVGLGNWNVTILATDINPVALRKAARGVYGAWSFRTTPAWVQARYFARDNKSGLEIRPSIRKRVTFTYLNLVDDVYPSLSNHTNAMDLIVCRNVLMYFTADQARKVVENLRLSLVDGGWLVVAPAETSTSMYARFACVEFPGAIFYRKSEAEALPEPPALHTALDRMEIGPWREMVPVELIAETALPQNASFEISATSWVAASSEVLPDGPSPPLSPPPQAMDGSKAREYANQGRLAEAAECCEKAMAADKLNPAPHYLYAVIQQEQGQYDLAIQSLTRAVYLDSRFVLAYFALGNLHLALGRRREAGRHFRNALELLQQLPPDDIVPESEGLSAGRLAEIVSSVLSSLPSAKTADA
ncbi:CheR family methyltransferase [Dyella subtropica]|uniref:CheR family methyltransferase n=1 Tax=Dyella subtropica TaxID=2992127 RepID=UPI002256825B|nr:CheR family methyltransferase [Dyella subtropica]